MPGSIIAVAAPKILPPKNRKSTDIALSINNADQILVIGRSPDFGYCKQIKRNQRRCETVINSSLNDYCVHHSIEKYKKIAGQRTDLNRSKMRSIRYRSSIKDLSGEGKFRYGTQSIYVNDNRNKVRNGRLLKKRSILSQKTLVTKSHTRGVKLMMNIKKKKENMQRMEKLNKLFNGKFPGPPPKLGRDWHAKQLCIDISDEQEILHSKSYKLAIAKLKGKKISKVNPNRTTIIKSISSSSDSKTNSNGRKRKRLYVRERDDEHQPPSLKRNRLSSQLNLVSDDILERRSINDQLPKQKKRMQLEQELEVLEEGEKIDRQLSEINSINIRIYVCTFHTCSLKGKAMEKINSFCGLHERYVNVRKGKKYFWECGKCHQKKTTLNSKRVGMISCRKCGQRCLIKTSAFNLKKMRPKSSDVNGEGLIIRNNRK